MAHKYRKITEDDVLSLFSKYDVITREIVREEFGCSEYSVIREIDSLKDEGVLVKHRFGYMLNLNND